MTMEAIYKPEILRAAYKLRYAWTGWASSGRLPERPANDAFWRALDTAWESDGLHRLEGLWKSDMTQLVFSVLPHVSPVLFTARVKGRLQHALRIGGQETKFSRKVAFRTVGENRRADVEAYIERQVDKERFVDPNYQRLMKQFTIVNQDVDLSKPTETNSGRYWYDLHLVLVTEHRQRITEPPRLARVRDLCIRIAEKKGYLISRLSVLPDHIHMSLRGNIEHSPEEIALSYLNNLSYALGRNAIWQQGYYAGTFGEYDMGALRH